MKPRNHTRLSLSIHMLGILFAGMAIGLNSYKYLDGYLGLAIFGLPLLTLLCILVSMVIEQRS